MDGYTYLCEFIVEINFLNKNIRLKGYYTKERAPEIRKDLELAMGPPQGSLNLQEFNEETQDDFMTMFQKGDRFAIDIYDNQYAIITLEELSKHDANDSAFFLEAVFEASKYSCLLIKNILVARHLLFFTHAQQQAKSAAMSSVEFLNLTPFNMRNYIFTKIYEDRGMDINFAQQKLHEKDITSLQKAAKKIVQPVDRAGMELDPTEKYDYLKIKNAYEYPNKLAILCKFNMNLNQIIQLNPIKNKYFKGGIVKLRRVNPPAGNIHTDHDIQVTICNNTLYYCNTWGSPCAPLDLIEQNITKERFLWGLKSKMEHPDSAPSANELRQQADSLGIDTSMLRSRKQLVEHLFENDIWVSRFAFPYIPLPPYDSEDVYYKVVGFLMLFIENNNPLRDSDVVVGRVLERVLRRHAAVLGVGAQER